MVRLKDKVLAVMLTCLIPFQGMGALAAEGDAALAADTKTVYLSENFNSYDEGAQKTGELSINHKGNKYGVVKRAVGDNALEMSVTTDKDMYVEKIFNTACTGSVIMEMEICMQDYADTQKTLSVKNSSNAEWVLARFLPGGALVLYDGTTVAGYMTGKYYKFAVALDFDANRMDVYFNGKKRVSNYKMPSKDLTNLALFRIQLATPREHSTICLDNVRIYSGRKLLAADELDNSGGDDVGGNTTVSDETVSKTMADSIGMFMNKPNAYVRGKKTYISDNRNVVPVWKNGQAMIPVRFFSDSIGAKVLWNQSDDSVTLGKSETAVSLIPGAAEMTVNGKKVALAEAAYTADGTMYAPIYELCDAFDMPLFCDESGMVIIGAGQLSWEDDLDLLRKISERYIYDDVSGARLLEMLQQKNPSAAHPRLILTNDKLNTIKTGIANNEEIYTAAFAAVKAEADGYLNTEPLSYKIADGIRLLPVSRGVLARVTALAAVYNLTGEEKYAIRCRREMISACSFADWHPYHFLDTAEMATAIAFGYDWLYNWFTPEDRAFFRNAIVTKAVDRILDDFDGRSIHQSDQSNLLSRSSMWSSDYADNWRIVCCGGVSVASLAIADELDEESRLKCERVLGEGPSYMKPVLSLFAPDGGYEEGITYWGYVSKYLSYYVSSLQTALGSDFGYGEAPGMRHTVDFVYAVNGPVAKFAYHDNDGTDTLIEPYVMFYANEYGDYGAASPRLHKILDGEGDIHDLMYYNTKFSEAETATGELDTLLSGVGVFAARSGWDDDAMYVGFHSDEAYAGLSHDHLDGGEFILQAMGESYFVDLGKDSYNIPNYQCDAYRTRAEGHNTLVINPNGQKFDQTFAGWAEIDKYVSKPRGAYAASDLSGLYSDYVTSAWRGVKLDNYRRTVTVQDEIVMKEPSELYWFAHTPAQIKISDDGKKAYLTIHGKTLLAEIAEGDGAVFTVMEAKPLPTSPNPAGQNPNKGYQKLAIHMTNVTELNLSVIFNCYNADYDENSYSRDFVPIADWDIEDGEYPVSHAEAEAISLNGQPLVGFEPDVYEYEVQVGSKDEMNPQITARADGKVEVTQSEVVPGKTFVSVLGTDGVLKKGYEINFKLPGYIGLPSGGSSIRPASVKASAVPQPENNPQNTLDGKFDTRWSCDNICWIEYDLGSVYNLDAVSLAFMNGDQRTAQFAIELSEDGVDYTEVFEGDSLPTTGFETHTTTGFKARYVRINCYGYNGSTKEWNSITECKFFGNK